MEKGLGSVPYHLFFNGLLASLEVLHIFWTYLIWKVIEKAIIKKKIDDSRSDSDSDDDEDETNEGKSKKD